MNQRQPNVLLTSAVWIVGLAWAVLGLLHAANANAQAQAPIAPWIPMEPILRPAVDTPVVRAYIRSLQLDEDTAERFDSVFAEAAAEFDAFVAESKPIVDEWNDWYLAPEQRPARWSPAHERHWQDQAERSEALRPIAERQASLDDALIEALVEVIETGTSVGGTVPTGDEAQLSLRRRAMRWAALGTEMDARVDLGVVLRDVLAEVAPDRAAALWKRPDLATIRQEYARSFGQLLDTEIESARRVARMSARVAAERARRYGPGQASVAGHRDDLSRAHDREIERRQSATARMHVVNRAALEAMCGVLPPEISVEFRFRYWYVAALDGYRAPPASVCVLVETSIEEAGELQTALRELTHAYRMRMPSIARAVVDAERNRRDAMSMPNRSSTAEEDRRVAAERFRNETTAFIEQALGLLEDDAAQQLASRLGVDWPQDEGASAR